MRLMLFAVALMGCNASGVAVPEKPTGCVLDLEFPERVHLEAPQNPPCPPGIAACELPAFCRAPGQALGVFFYSKTVKGTLDAGVNVKTGVMGFNWQGHGWPGYTCSAQSDGIREQDGRWMVDFLLPCANASGDTYEVSGTLSGPTTAEGSGID